MASNTRKKLTQSHISFSEGLKLFLLDDEGVLFDADRAEIYRLNTAAAFIWCCLEEHMPYHDVVAEFSSAFGMTEQEAASHVHQTIGQWSGLGYITGAGLPKSSTVHFTTAFGRLLASKRLQARFAESPFKTAREIGVQEQDLANFSSLDPVEVSLQSNALRQKALSKRYRQDINLFHRKSEDEIFRPLDKPACVGNYSLLKSVFQIRFESDEQLQAINPAISHLITSRDKNPDIVIDVIHSQEEHIILENGNGVTRCTGLNSLAPAFKSWLRQSIVNRHDYFMQIHAATVMTTKNQCILLPAAPGSGKTTLSAALAGRGMRFLTDEIALLENSDLRVNPMPLSMAIKAGSITALSDYYPTIAQLPEHLRQDERLVRYLVPPELSLQYDFHECYPIKWIIFPKYQPDLNANLNIINRAEALSRLMGECAVLPAELSKHNVAKLVRWLKDVDCYELNFSDLAEATEVVRKICC